jgi:hypothetical protein
MPDALMRGRSYAAFAAIGKFDVYFIGFACFGHQGKYAHAQVLRGQVGHYIAIVIGNGSFYINAKPVAADGFKSYFRAHTGDQFAALWEKLISLSEAAALSGKVRVTVVRLPISITATRLAPFKAVAAAPLNSAFKTPFWSVVPLPLPSSSLLATTVQLTFFPARARPSFGSK